MKVITTNLIEEQNPSIALQGSLNTEVTILRMKIPKPKASQPFLLSQNLIFHHLTINSKNHKSVKKYRRITDWFNANGRIHFKRNAHEGQQYSSHRNTPLNNMNPSQFYNGMHKSNNPKFAGYRNNPFPVKGIPIKVTGSKHVPLTDSPITNTEAQQESVKHDLEVTPIIAEEKIEIVKEIIPKNEKPIEMVKETIQEKVEQTAELSEPIQKKEETSESVNEPLVMKDEPIAIINEPSPKNDEPVAITNELSPKNVEPVAIANEPSPKNVEPVASAIEPSTKNVEPAAIAIEPSPKNVEPVASAIEPSTKKEEQSGDSDHSKQQEQNSKETLSIFKQFWKKLI